MDDTTTDPLSNWSSTGKSKKTLADEAVKRAVQMVAQLNKFKQPRLAQIKKYRDLYAGKMPRKFRQPFNVVLPVFAGAMDTLAADFNDDLALEFEPREQADYLATRKINALWSQEVDSVATNAMFAHKARTDRHNALFSGRGFMMNYAVSEPTYRNHFEIFEFEDAIFQPQGGGMLENHVFKGRDNIVRSAADLKNYDIYDKAQVTELLAIAKPDYFPTFDQAAQGNLAKYNSMGLSPEDSDYVGDAMFRLVEMVLPIDGVMYYLVYSPWFEKWVRFDTLKTTFSADQYPATSWATHEDNKNFASKSYADDMYGVAESVLILVNQELTNREKRNFNARGYDVSMFPDVEKLDIAQTRPDALVPVTVPAGKRVEDGIFTFQTAELRGSIDLAEWMQTQSGIAVGVTDSQMGGSTNVSKKATVLLSEQQNISKRLLLRSSSYTEAMARVGKFFVQGARDHLPAKMAIRRLGIEGEGWEQVIRRTDLDLYGDIDVKIRSSAIDMKNSQLKKESRMKVLEQIAADPILAQITNPQWRAEELLRSGGEYDEAEVKLALDTKNYGNKEEQAYAHMTIQAVLNGEKTQTYYGATTLFLKIIYDFAVNNRGTMGDRKYNRLMDVIFAHQSVVQENMDMKAQLEASTAPADPNVPTGTAPQATTTPTADPSRVPSASAMIKSVTPTS